MAKPVKIRVSGIPDELNGINALAQAMLRDTSGQMYLVVGLAVCAEVNDNRLTGERVPTLKFLQLEVISGEDVKPGTTILTRANDQRQGRTRLPLQAQLDIDAIFTNWPDDLEGGNAPPEAD